MKLLRTFGLLKSHIHVFATATLTLLLSSHGAPAVADRLPPPLPDYQCEAPDECTGYYITVSGDLRNWGPGWIQMTPKFDARTGAGEAIRQLHHVANATWAADASIYGTAGTRLALPRTNACNMPLAISSNSDKAIRTFFDTLNIDPTPVFTFLSDKTINNTTHHLVILWDKTGVVTTTVAPRFDAANIPAILDGMCRIADVTVPVQVPVCPTCPASVTAACRQPASLLGKSCFTGDSGAFCTWAYNKRNIGGTWYECGTCKVVTPPPTWW